jgi:hypothetical protein
MATPARPIASFLLVNLIYFETSSSEHKLSTNLPSFCIAATIDSSKNKPKKAQPVR